VRHLLVTNDFPPKMGGIQSYLWELWRRLPPEDVTVLTTPHDGAAAWDAVQAYRVVRTREPVLLPTPPLARRIDALADEVGAELVVLDPALPLGALGPSLRHPYGLVLHGAEVTVPGRLPGSGALLRKVLVGARIVVAAGGYPLAEAERCAGSDLPSVVVAPGVDVDRFHPLDDEARAAARKRLGLPTDPAATLVLGVSRLVPRKGFDVVLRAAGRLAAARPQLHVAIAGGGRDEDRLRRIAAAAGAPATFLGRVPDADLPDLYGTADVFAMLCRNRWGGLEQEGFGIVFLEAAAAGVPQVAGRSGGADEAVAHGVTGFVVDPPTDVDATARAIGRLVDDEPLRRRLGAAARGRAVHGFTYDLLAARLAEAIAGTSLP
jgi:phosphatidylinositol alpha-1,6-mannosyltransferase